MAVRVSSFLSFQSRSHAADLHAHTGTQLMLLQGYGRSLQGEARSVLFADGSRSFSDPMAVGGWLWRSTVSPYFTYIPLLIPDGLRISHTGTKQTSRCHSLFVFSVKYIVFVFYILL